MDKRKWNFKVKRNFLVLSLILVLIISLAGCGTQSGTKSPQTSDKQPAAVSDAQKDTLLVNADWLKSNLDKVVVIDARKDVDYNKGHVPGAVNAIWQGFAAIKGQPGDPGWGVLLPKDELAAKIGALGIDGSKAVVVYAQPPGWGEEGRIVWMLRMAGIKDAKMLDGGLEAWEQAGGELSKDAVKAKAVSFAIASLDESYTSTTDWIVKNQKTIKIIDSRSEKEYKGAADFGEARGGHLPGAINIPFENMFNKDGSLKSSAELKEMFTAAGLNPEDEIVSYCTKGIRSAYMTLTLRMVGFEKARNYDPSYYEWAGNDKLPVEK